MPNNYVTSSYLLLIVIVAVYCSLKIMECHSVAQRKVKFINALLVVRATIMARVVRHTDVVLLLTGQATLYFTLCMDRLVSNERVPSPLKKLLYWFPK